MPLRDRLPFPAEPLYLIDGSSFVYRGFYAFGDLTRSDGFPTNALLSVMRLGIRLVREERPGHAAFVLDGPGKNHRHTLFPAYKAQRLAMPEPLAQQMEPIARGMALLGFPVLRREGVEADDVIASLAAANKARRPVVIVGTDKDLRQCLDASVILWDPSGKEEKLITLEDFLRDFPPGPARWPDFQALTGDASDNIPGAPGIGPKTAAEILAGHPSLEDIRNGLDALKPAWRKKLEPCLDELFVYRELTRLRLDATPDLRLEDLALRPAPRSEQEAFLKEFELRSLARDLPAEAQPPQAKAQVQAQAAGQLSLFDRPPPAAAEPEALAPTPLSELPALDGRSLALVPLEAGFSLAVAGREWLVQAGPDDVAPFAARAGQVAVPSVKDLLTAGDAWRAVPLERFFDLGLAAYLLSPEDRVYTWQRLRDALFTDPTWDPAEAPIGSQALACLALAARQGARLEQAGLTPLMRELELPLIPVLVRMERRGIGIDASAFAAFLEEVNAELDRLTRVMHEQAGVVFNLRSSQQLADVLYNRLGLKAPGKTPGGAASTSAEVLERLAGRHPLVDSILEYRKLEKLRSTYLEPLPKLADAAGRIHTSFNNLATATGRLSSSAPNLQNIPVRGDLGRRVRALFVAAPGHVLASADYSQIELRVLAHFSQDPTLLAAFREGQDIHARTASLLFDRPQAEITPGERRQAKTVNFGLLYGMGPQKLGRELDMTLSEAKEFIARYFERLTGLKTYYQQVVDQAKTQGSVTTLAGRRRLLPDIHSRNTQLEAQAKRQAINTTVQGSAADIIKMAMLQTDADPELAALGARLILQVHDELVIEVPEADGRRAGERLAEIMSGVAKLSVPVAVDVGVGRNWALAH